ncbi:hypothetical protein [Chryseobacterium koreense]
MKEQVPIFFLNCKLPDLLKKDQTLRFRVQLISFGFRISVNNSLPLDGGKTFQRIKKFLVLGKNAGRKKKTE